MLFSDRTFERPENMHLAPPELYPFSWGPRNNTTSTCPKKQHHLHTVNSNRHNTTSMFHDHHAHGTTTSTILGAVCHFPSCTARHCSPAYRCSSSFLQTNASCGVTAPALPATLLKAPRLPWRSSNLPWFTTSTLTTVRHGCKCNQALSGFWLCWPHN